jgi:hypothetical protein
MKYLLYLLALMCTKVEAQALVYKVDLPELGLVKELHENCLWGLFDENGNEKLPVNYASIKVAPVGPDFLATVVKENATEYHLVTGEKTHRLYYKKVTILNDRLLAVGAPPQVGIINTLGEGRALLNYTALEPFGGNWVKVTQQGKFGLFDANAKVVLPCIYTDLIAWHNAKTWVSKGRGYQCFQYDTIMSATTYEAVKPRNTLALVQLNNKWGLIDATTKTKFECTYQAAQWLNDTLIARSTDGMKWELFNVNTSTAIKTDYSNVETFAANESLICVTKGTKKGIINAEGKLVLPVTYEAISVFSQLIGGLSSKGWKLYTLEGKVLNKTYYMGVEQHAKGILIQEDSKWGMLNHNGTERFKPSFQNLKPLGAYFSHQVEGKTGLVNDKGLPTTPVFYDAIRVVENYFKAFVGGKSLHITGDGKRLNCTGQLLNKP